MTATISLKTVTNLQLTLRSLQALLDVGVREFCICPGGRNSTFVQVLLQNPELKCHYWFEERSAAFFALGRARQLGAPVAVITTSGTAAGELLPAAMEAHYTSTPLVLLTADRPRRYRGTGAPQTAEQVDLFGCYVDACVDREGEEEIDLKSWKRKGPIHLNICFEEPARQYVETPPLDLNKIDDQRGLEVSPDYLLESIQKWRSFWSKVKRPLVIVSTLPANSRRAVKKLLEDLNAPVFIEAISGLREDKDLDSMRLYTMDRGKDRAIAGGYDIDGVLRIGGVPTHRFWRDLEDREDIPVLSLSHVPFTGLSRGELITAPLENILPKLECPWIQSEDYSQWMATDRQRWQALEPLFTAFPHAEPSLVHAFSLAIPDGSRVYLGNSLPIREWDTFASFNNRQLSLHASRGLNGIDGQISTFLGLASHEQPNWALIGDLTALYDLAAPWILSQLPELPVSIAVINNGGGKIFDRMFPFVEMQNCHNIHFKPIADLWGLDYERYERLPDKFSSRPRELIEIIPSNEETRAFWDAYGKIG